MEKQEYLIYFPEIGESKLVRINPTHMEEVAAAICATNQSMMTVIQHGWGTKHQVTDLICLFEDNKFKFFYEEESL